MGIAECRALDVQVRQQAVEPARQVPRLAARQRQYGRDGRHPDEQRVAGHADRQMVSGF